MSTEANKAAAEEAITKEALTRYQATTGPRLREIILKPDQASAWLCARRAADLATSIFSSR
jgi:hypothetical protein